MTIAATTRKAGPFIGTGSVYRFEFAFKVFARSEVIVTVSSNDVVETVLELDTDYSVSLNEDQDVNPGGTVTLDEALPEGDKLAITSAVPYSQEIALTNKGGFYPTILNEALDKLTAQCQQLQEQNTRTVTVPATSSISPSEYLNEIFDARETAIEKASAAASSASSSSTSATKAQTWAEGTDAAVSVLGGTHSAKGWVNLMSPHFTAIEAVYADAENVDTVAASITNVNTVAGSIAVVTSVANDLTAIKAVNNNKTNIDTVAGAITNVGLVAADIANVNAVASDLTNVDAVVANATNINTVASDIADVNAVGADIASVNSVAGDLTNIDAVNANKTNIDAVASNIANVNAVAGIASDVTAVAGNGTDVSAVADDITSVVAVAADLTNIDAASGYAADSKQWAIGEPTEPAGGSAKYWAGQASAGQINADWAETDTTSKAYILNKPSLASVATSGLYSDLAGTPSLATVATSGLYSDLTGTPGVFVGSGSSAASGLVPAPDSTAGTTKYLREDGSWTTPPNDNTDSKASSSNSTSKLYLIGATSQSSSGQTTYSHSSVYATNGAFVASTVQASSDRRLKDDLEAIDVDLSTLRAYRYTFKPDGKKHIGLIAQDVQAIAPEAVGMNADTEMLTLDYNAVVALLVAKVNRQQAEIDFLKNKLGV